MSLREMSFEMATSVCVFQSTIILNNIVGESIWSWHREMNLVLYRTSSITRYCHTISFITEKDTLYLVYTNTKCLCVCVYTDF